MRLTGAMPVANDIAKFWSQISKEECWMWQGRVHPIVGYGLWSWKSKAIGAHRFAWELINGPITDGREIHHMCHVKLCCNPEHMELLTRGEHRKLVRFPPTNGNEKKTHCLRGHAFTEENTIRRQGRRICSLCETYRGRKNYLRRKFDGNNPRLSCT